MRISAQTDIANNFQTDQLPILITPGCRVLNEQAVLKTDAGSYLPMYGWALQSCDFNAYISECEEYYDDQFAIKPISRANPRANCHGWVFAGGRCLLYSEQVQQILLDHDYYPVLLPLPGDVIIYFDAQGNVSHSGIVFSSSDGGETVIQSKFGLGPIYLHPPEAQPYSTEFAYFRTDRNTHEVRLCSVTEMERQTHPTPKP